MMIDLFHKYDKIIQWWFVLYKLGQKESILIKWPKSCVFYTFTSFIFTIDRILKDHTTSNF